MATTAQSPPDMDAAYVTAPGPAGVIHYGRLPLPETGPTDVLVRVRTVAVNPVDTFIRSGAYPTPMPTPFVIGRDLVGEVTAAGSGATGFAPGQRVWCNSLGHGGRQGSFSEFAAVAADRLYLVPDDVDSADLAAAAHPAASAWLALFRHGQLRARQTVYVGGGAGNVGSAAVALAAAAGVRVVATASRRDFDHVRALGADEVVDYHDPDVSERLREASPGGFDVHLDTSGYDELATSVELLARGARLIAMVGSHGTPALPVGRLYTRDASIVGFVISNATTASLAEAASGVVWLLRTTPWRPRIADRLLLSQAAEAHQRIEDGHVRGRLILDTPGGAAKRS